MKKRYYFIMLGMLLLFFLFGNSSDQGILTEDTVSENVVVTSQEAMDTYDEESNQPENKETVYEKTVLITLA